MFLFGYSQQQNVDPQNNSLIMLLRLGPNCFVILNKCLIQSVSLTEEFITMGVDNIVFGGALEIVPSTKWWPSKHFLLEQPLVFALVESLEHHDETDHWEGWTSLTFLPNRWPFYFFSTVANVTNACTTSLCTPGELCMYNVK